MWKYTPTGFDVIVAECDRCHAKAVFESIGRVVDHPLFDFGPGVLVVGGLFLTKDGYSPPTIYFKVYDLSGNGTWERGSCDCPVHRHVRINDTRGLVDLSEIEFKEVG
jgi:hypothetical protein